MHLLKMFCSYGIELGIYVRPSLAITIAMVVIQISSQSIELGRELVQSNSHGIVLNTIIVLIKLLSHLFDVVSFEFDHLCFLIRF